MSQTLPIVIVTGLLAGGVGAVATTALRSAPSNAGVSGSTSVDDEILVSLDGIRADMNSLADRIGLLESQDELAPISSGVASSRLSAGAPEITKEVLQEALASLAEEGANEVSPVTAQLVESVIEQREARARQEAEERRAAERDKRLEDKLAKMQSELGLDMNQLASLRTVYQDGDTKMRDMWTQARSGDAPPMDRDQIREAMVAFRDEQKAAIQGVLTSSQFELYEENGYDNRWGGGGRGAVGTAQGGGGRGNGGGGRRGGF